MASIVQYVLLEGDRLCPGGQDTKWSGGGGDHFFVTDGLGGPFILETDGPGGPLRGGGELLPKFIFLQSYCIMA